MTASAHTLPSVIRVGTRGSPLALVQTRDFIARLTQACVAAGRPAAVVEVQIRTTGDAVQDRRLAEIGGKGLFAREIHAAMQEGRIDLAVHSLKDLETELPDGIVLGATLAREDPRDALILGPGCLAPNAADPFAALPQGGVIGTSSVRRQSQLLHRRPDLTVALLRGNVQTRLDRTAGGAFAASLLAVAGLKRLGLEAHAQIRLDPEIMVPSACQGIVGVTARGGEPALLGLLARIEDPETRQIADAERAMLAVLDGSCRTPIGGFATVFAPGTLRLTGLVARPDGSFLVRRSLDGAVGQPLALGKELGAALRRDCPADVFA